MTLSPLVRTITLTDMIAYAGATWDWHRLHYDPEFLASKGLDCAVVDGQALGALMAEQILDDLGPKAFILSLGIKYKSMMYAGDTVQISGTRVAEDAGTATFTHEATVDGRIVAEGKSTVRLGR